MKISKHICAALVVIFATSLAFSQKTFQPKQPGDEWKGVIYRKETAVEVRMHTNGLLLFGVNIGEIRSYYKTNYYHMSLGFLKDPRERRQNKNRIRSFSSSRSFALGKQNSVFVLRGGMGTKKFISEKAKRKGIAIGYDYQVGPAIALLKPYYLEIEVAEVDQTSLQSVRYTEENEEVFLDKTGAVFGGASYFQGFSEMTVVPGIQGKLGLFFSLGAFDEKIKTFETGIMFDIYIRKLPIMVETPTVSNKPFFVNFYVNMLFGSRRN